MTNESQGSALAELRELGLTIHIDESAAIRIKARLMIVEGQFHQEVYHQNRDPQSGTPRKPYHDAYDAIAQEIVTPYTPDKVLTDDIPGMVHAFHLRGQWMPRLSLEVMRLWLQGSVTEWKGKRLLMKGESSQPIPRASREFREPNPNLLSGKDTVNRKMAVRALGITDRTLQRHVASGKLIPVGPGNQKRFKAKDLLRLLNEKNLRQGGQKQTKTDIKMET